MAATWKDLTTLREYRNTKLYRSLTRTLRVYNRLLLTALHARGFDDFSPAFPSLLSNLDTRGTRIGVLATRAGVTRQAAGQLLREIERCGYVDLRAAPDDARATTVFFTERGKRLLATVLELVDGIENEFARTLKPGEFERIRAGLLEVADSIDPGGRLGEGDDQRSGDNARRGRRAVEARQGRREPVEGRAEQKNRPRRAPRVSAGRGRR